jgi:hypothetical protein
VLALLDFAREYLDALALLVGVGNGTCGHAEEIDKEVVTVARFYVTISDVAQA